MKIIDCRGLNCPEPVLRTKSAIADDPLIELTIIVDNQAARDNVIRFARDNGRDAKWRKVDHFFHVNISKTKEKIEPAIKDEINTALGENPVLLIATDEFGQGSRELGLLLMRNFIYTLTQRDEPPHAIVFMNAGIKLTVDGSPVLEELAALQEKGVLLLVCGTCLDYYQLTEKHEAGQVSNMYDIADLLSKAKKVITL